MPMSDLTEREAEVLEAVSGFIAEKGFSPSIDEIAALAGIGRSTVHRTLVELKDKEKVSWDPTKNRTLSVRS